MEASGIASAEAEAEAEAVAMAVREERRTAAERARTKVVRALYGMS
jgi:hypothetical protein